MTNEELERAVEEVEALVLTYADNTQYDAFRAVLSERAELLAAVERMRGSVTGLLSFMGQLNPTEFVAAYGLPTPSFLSFSQKWKRNE